MSIKHRNAAFLTAALVFGAVSTGVAAGDGSHFGAAADARTECTGVDARSGAAAVSSGENDAVEQTWHPSGLAPIGHRQPQAGDIPAPPELSPSELEQRRLDQDLDRRLIICRGC